jgi:hypothetical protein
MLPSASLNHAFALPSGKSMTPSTVLKWPKSYSSSSTPRSRSRATAARTSGTVQFMTVFFAVPANSDSYRLKKAWPTW